LTASYLDSRLVRVTRKSDWPKGVEIQKTALGLPRRLWEEAKIRAMKEGRTSQEFIAEALKEHLAGVEEYLERIYKSGKAPWEDLDAAARRRGQVFRGWERGPGGRLQPKYLESALGKQPKKGAKS
jgi:hypothetical protein